MIALSIKTSQGGVLINRSYDSIIRLVFFIEAMDLIIGEQRNACLFCPEDIAMIKHAASEFKINRELAHKT